MLFIGGNLSLICSTTSNHVIQWTRAVTDATAHGIGREAEASLEPKACAPGLARCFSQLRPWGYSAAVKGAVL